MEHGDVHFLSQALLHDEAFRGLDVLQIDGTESRLQRLDNLDERFRLLDIQLDVEHVHIGINLEEETLTLHHRLGCMRADIAQTQYGRAVTDDTHQVTTVGVQGRFRRIGCNLIAGDGYAGRIGQRQVINGKTGLAGQHLQFTGARLLMIPQCSLS